MGRFLQLPAAVIAIVSSHSLLQPWEISRRKKMDKIKVTERSKHLIGFQSAIKLSMREQNAALKRISSKCGRSNLLMPRDRKFSR
jgi:hypothetical protein